MFTEGAIQFFNLFYTSLPIIILGVYDTDLAREFVYRNPRLYQAGVKNQYFNVSETSLPSLPLLTCPYSGRSSGGKS
jgi:magnesium-transporting ATPase (P-type)